MSLDDTTLSIIGILIATAALVVSVIALYPRIIQRRIDRNPKRYYRFEGPEHGWADLGDAGRPQLGLTIWNYRSVPVELGIHAMDVRPGHGGGGTHLFEQTIMLGHALGSNSTVSEIEVPPHGCRHLSIMGRTPTPGYRGDIGVAISDGEKRIFLIYHHRTDDPPPFEGSIERNAVPTGIQLGSSGTFGESTTIRLNGT